MLESEGRSRDQSPSDSDTVSLSGSAASGDAASARGTVRGTSERADSERGGFERGRIGGRAEFMGQLNGVNGKNSYFTEIPVEVEQEPGPDQGSRRGRIDSGDEGQGDEAGGMFRGRRLGAQTWGPFPARRDERKPFKYSSRMGF